MDRGGIASPPKTQYEEMRDNDFRHLEHQDKDDLLATQLIRRNQLRADELLGDNHAAPNGILESITCVNFMCHERLHCDLGPLLNFIVGENGSGKSAILTAITLCLGGKASSTNRGGSLKNFVKEGCERASLIVKIKNQGEDGYRRDLYGDSILVERHFSKNGASGFKVKSEMGAIISTKKSEVDEIVEYYALQVDNPLNVLSQDNARQFLNQATPAQKYKYFFEGVQLEQLDRDYRLVQEFLEQSEAKAPLQRERVETLKADMKKAEKAYESAKSNGQARRQLRLLRNQVVWAQVTEEEQILANMDQEILDFEQTIERLQEEILTCTTQMQEYDGIIAQKKALLDAAKQEDADYDAGLQGLRADYNEGRNTLEALHQDERDAHMQATRARERCAELEAKIEHEMKRLEDANGDKPIQLRKELDAMQERRTNMVDEVAATKEVVAELEIVCRDTERKCQASQQAVKDAHQAVQQKKKEIDDAQRILHQLQHGQGGKYDAYPEGMEALVKAIAQDTGFKDRPIGPIGTHVQLLKPEWSTILEKQLGNLSDFIVTNVADQKRLQEHINRYIKRDRDTRNPPPFVPIQITIGKFTTIDPTGHEPDEQFDTILRVLNIDNDIVKSQLIISNGIEQVILIRDRVKAEEIMFSGRAPRNVKMCFCEHDGRKNHGLVLMNKGGGSFSTSTIFPHPRQPARMKTDRGAQAKAQQEVLEYLQQELRVLQDRQAQLRQEHETDLKELEEKKTEIQTKIKAYKKLDDQILTVVDVQIQKVEADLDVFEGADSRLDGLRAELKEAQEKEEHYGTQYAELVVKKENYNTEVEERRTAYRTEKERKKEFEKKVQDAEMLVQRLEEARKITLAELNSKHPALDSAKIEKNRLAGMREDQVEGIRSVTEQAQQYGDRVHIAEGQTHATLKAQYEAIYRQVAEAEKSRGMTDKEAMEQYAKAKQAHEAAYQNLKVLEKINAQMKKTLQERLNKWRLFQRFVSANARGAFATLLSERGFRGQLLLDHKNHTLQLVVQTEKTEKNSAGKSTKSLSGGEKSFSSICLLLAIWDAMGSPLRCLDEFDVFMDNVNRAISTNMLASIPASRLGQSVQLLT
jgi:chromosome segregation ATPase